MLTVQAPSGTQLEVPIPDGVSVQHYSVNLLRGVAGYGHLLAFTSCIMSTYAFP